MRRPFAFSIAVVAILSVLPGRAAGPGPLAGAPVRTFSIVVPDADRFGAAWADVLGADMPKVLEYPGLVFPPDFDKTAYPRIANFRMANVAVSMHQPAGGRSYWKEVLDAHGPALYRMNFQVPDLPSTVAALQALGGRLVVGTPEGGGTNVNLWPGFGFAVELGAAPRAPVTAPSSPARPVSSGFAAHAVSTISLVVEDIGAAVRPYAEIFGAEVPPVRERSVSIREGASRPRRLTLKSATIDLPGDIDIELIEPPTAANPWRAHLRRHGNRALFAVGVRVADVAAQAAYLGGKGGILKAGGPGEPIALVDLTDRLGVQFELHASTR